MLAKVDDWQFDAFKLNEVSGGRPLSLLSYALLKRCEVADKFEMDDHRLVKFLMRVEDGYPNNPYHNRIHAADVLQSLHVLVVRGGLIGHGFCDEVSLTSCYLSAVSGRRGLEVQGERWEYVHGLPWMEVHEPARSAPDLFPANKTRLWACNLTISPVNCSI